MASLVHVHDAGAAVVLIALTLAVTVTVDVIWVRYNLSLHRRKPARRSLPTVSEEVTVDAIGRRIVHPGLEALQEARQVVVSVRDGIKRLEPAPDRVPRPAAGTAPAGTGETAGPGRGR